MISVEDGSPDFAAFVRLVIEALEAAGVEYLVGGAVAAWAWGEPRTTQDLDVVARIPLMAAERLSAELEERRMLVPPEVICDVILEERADLAIDAIHLDTGYKVEIFPMRPHDDLRRLALARRRRVDLGPDLGQVYVHSPEDLVLYKLSYYALSAQTKHMRDIAAIAHSVGDELDVDYLERWANYLGVRTLLSALLGWLWSGESQEELQDS